MSLAASLKKDLPGTPSVQVAAFLFVLGTVLDVAITFFQESNDPNGYWRDDTPVGYYLYFFAAVLFIRAWLVSHSDQVQEISLTCAGPAPTERIGPPVKIGPKPPRGKHRLLPIFSPFPLTNFVLLLATFLSLMLAICAVTRIHRYIQHGVWVYVVGGPISLNNPSIPVDPVIVSVRFEEKTRLIQISVDGAETSFEVLPVVLRTKLKGRPDWMVYVNGQSSLAFQDVAQVLDTIQRLPAKVVILMPKSDSQSPTDRRH